jgi:hypothetical protein
MNQKTQYPCIGRQGQQTKIYLNCGAIGNNLGNTLGALLGTWWEPSQSLKKLPIGVRYIYHVIYLYQGNRFARPTLVGTYTVMSV